MHNLYPCYRPGSLERSTYVRKAIYVPRFQHFEGFGPRNSIRPTYRGGPYDCEHWLKGVLPQEVLDTLWFDSESSEFYCYSSDRDSLEIILDVLTDTIDRLNNCLEEYTHQMLQVFNGPLPFSLWAHPKVHTIGIGDHPTLPELTSDLPPR